MSRFKVGDFAMFADPKCNRQICAVVGVESGEEQLFQVKVYDWDDRRNETHDRLVNESEIIPFPGNPGPLHMTLLYRFGRAGISHGAPSFTAGRSCLTCGAVTPKGTPRKGTYHEPHCPVGWALERTRKVSENKYLGYREESGLSRG